MNKFLFAYLRFFVPSKNFFWKNVVALSILTTFIFTPPAIAFKPFDDFINNKAQDPQVQVLAFINPEEVHPGGSFRFHLRVTIGDNWHIYSINNQDENIILNTKINFDQNIFQAEEEWKESPPKLAKDEVLQKTIKTHKGLAEFNRLHSIPSDLKPGIYNLSGSFLFRACDNKICTLEKKSSFRTQVKILNKI